MNKKLKLFSVLASVIMIGSTLGFATYALVNNNLNEIHQGEVTITGTAQLEVKIEVKASDAADYTTLTTANYAGKSDGTVVAQALADQTFDAGTTYTFRVTVTNIDKVGDKYSSVGAYVNNVAIVLDEAGAQYFTVGGTGFDSASNRFLEAFGGANSKSYEFTLTPTQNKASKLDDTFTYQVKVAANRAEA